MTGTTSPGSSLDYDVGWFAACKDKNIDREISKEVMEIAPGLYKKAR